jgi:hypothetical protein
MIVDPAVEAGATRIFGDEHLSVALEQLSLIQTVRVQLAVLALSEGSLERLRHFVEVAQVDYRDVLYWADNPPRDDEPKSWEELRRRLNLPET